MLVTGKTKSRLKDILPLGKEPKAGEDGVLSIRADGSIVYRIGSILYTDLPDGTTDFSYYPDNRQSARNGALLPIEFGNREAIGVTSLINFSRSPLSAFQRFYNLEYLENSDVTLFPDNFV